MTSNSNVYYKYQHTWNSNMPHKMYNGQRSQQQFTYIFKKQREQRDDVREKQTQQTHRQQRESGQRTQDIQQRAKNNKKAAVSETYNYRRHHYSSISPEAPYFATEWRRRNKRRNKPHTTHIPMHTHRQQYTHGTTHNIYYAVNFK